MVNAAKFTKDSVCHYSIEWPANAKKGDVIYLNTITQRNVMSYIYIAGNVTDEYVI